jgi:hypothetical protein
VPESKMRYPGRCELCGHVAGKAQMTRHLKACLAGKAETGDLTARVFHLVIEGRGLPMYWLHVEIPGAMTLENLDAFLRGIWLECCDHLSCFTIDGQRYSVQPAESFFGGRREQTMRAKIYSVLREGLKFAHEYDYGSTTELSLRVMRTREGRFAKYPGIALLARNEPPAWVCSMCGKPATRVRTTGWGLGLDSLCCDDCGEGDEEGYLPVVNSPRTGVCGYSG